ncbi:MAG: redoxin domain-containing protein [Planctomycetaceae bacterium]|nr:redoxin domain-containing protein [Planctomycetaceae bacterium]
MSDELTSESVRSHHLAFQLKTLDGEVIDVKPGQRPVTVICFLGTECPLVQLYSARLSQMANEFRDRGVLFVGINSNFHDTDDDIRNYQQRQSLSFPLVRDEGNQVADRFGATRTPEVFVLNQQLAVTYQGRIDDQYEPGVTRATSTRDDLRLALEETLSGNAVTIAKTDAVGCMIGKIRHRKPASAETTATASITYCKEISRIMQKHCVECHRQGEIAPFSLEAYDDVAGWADTCLEVIDNGRMPPWHANPAHGNFTNARMMPESDKKTLRDWVAAGSPEGNMADLPEPVVYTPGWQMNREPDLIIDMRDRPYQVAAEGTIEYQYFVVDPGITEDAWVTAAQIIPGNRAVVHHAIVFIRPPDGSEFRGIGWLTAYVPGQRLVVMPPGHARKIPAGSRLVFQMHYTATGSPQADTTKVGIIFGKREEITHQVITLVGIDQEFEIPPYAQNHEVQGKVRWLPKDGRLLGVAPHMHVRGKSFELIADHDGQSETLLQVPHYDFNWQHSYVFNEPLDLNRIDGLRFKAAFDNSAANPFNPDPSQWVAWGDQTWEEMAVAFLEVAEPLNNSSHPDSPRHAGESSTSDVTGDRELRIQKFIDKFFADLDANDDGVVARSEAPIAVRNSFSRFDHDGNNLVTREEIRTVAERRIR